MRAASEAETTSVWGSASNGWGACPGWGCLLDVEQVEAFEATRFASLLNQLDPAVPGQHLTITRRQGTLVATVAEPGLTETRQAGLAGARILLTDPDFTQFSCEEDQP